MMYHIGIDLGGTNIAVGLVDAQGSILARRSIPTRAERTQDEVIADMAHSALTLIAEQGLTQAHIASVGIGSPGAVDSEAGVIASACNLPFRNTPLAARMRQYFDCPVYVENDANCAAWAEARAGAAKGARDCVMLTLGTGVGGGIVIGGRLYSGFNHCGGEFGHIVIRMDGELCACGRRGCLEAYASATALVRQARRAAEAHADSLLHACAVQEGELNGKAIFEAIRKGDPTAEAVLDEYVTYLAQGVMNLIAIFQPEVLVIGGGISQAGETLMAPLRERVGRRFGYLPPEKRTVIRAAMLGNDAGIVGAALIGSVKVQHI